MATVFNAASFTAQWIEAGEDTALVAGLTMFPRRATHSIRLVSQRLLHEPETLANMDADQTPQTVVGEIDKTDWDQPER